MLLWCYEKKFPEFIISTFLIDKNEVFSRKKKSYEKLFAGNRFKNYWSENCSLIIPKLVLLQKRIFLNKCFLRNFYYL